MFEPPSVDRALSLAHLQEVSLDIVAQRARGPNSVYGSSTNSYASSKPMVTSSTQLTRPSFVTSPQSAMVPLASPSFLRTKSLVSQNHMVNVSDKRLTLAEMQACQEKNLCFNCNKRYTDSYMYSQTNLYVCQWGSRVWKCSLETSHQPPSPH